MKALSIRQPWAWLIIRPDLTTPEQRAAALAAGHIKTIENRNWATNRRGFVLANAKPLPFREFKGALGFFDVPDEEGR